MCIFAHFVYKYGHKRGFKESKQVRIQFSRLNLVQDNDFIFKKFRTESQIHVEKCISAALLSFRHLPARFP